MVDHSVSIATMRACQEQRSKAPEAENVLSLADSFSFLLPKVFVPNHDISPEEPGFWLSSPAIYRACLLAMDSDDLKSL
jgi:hypothetical protein